MTKIVVSEFLDASALECIPDSVTVLYEQDLVDREADLLAEISDADALIVRNRTQVNQDLLSKAPLLKAVGRLGVGLDNIDLDACRERQVVVLPATGANNLSVAEYVIGTAMMLVRGAYQSTVAVMSGDWPRGHLIGGEISGKQLGLIGFGGIARQVATMASALGMSVSAYDPNLSADDPCWGDVRSLPLDDVLRTSDVLSLHVPLIDATRHLLNAETLLLMKPQAIVINTARGGVIDDQALANALSNGQLGGAALDVFECEPLTSDAGAMFEGLDNIVLTPHIAGVTTESNTRVSSVTVQNVLDALEIMQ